MPLNAGTVLAQVASETPWDGHLLLLAVHPFAFWYLCAVSGATLVCGYWAVSLDALLSPSPRGGHKTPSQTKQTSKSGNGGWRPFLPAPLIPLGILFSCLLYGWSPQFFLRVCDPFRVPSVHFFLLALDHMGSVAYSKRTGTDDTSSLKLLPMPHIELIPPSSFHPWT